MGPVFQAYGAFCKGNHLLRIFSVKRNMPFDNSEGSKVGINTKLRDMKLMNKVGKLPLEPLNELRTLRATVPVR
jgi:hypothetical protein